jgi:hypothetical protein
MSLRNDDHALDPNSLEICRVEGAPQIPGSTKRAAPSSSFGGPPARGHSVTVVKDAMWPGTGVHTSGRAVLPLASVEDG